VSSFAIVAVPSAAHTRRLQSPVICTVRTVPAVSVMLPQTPAVQVRCRHSPSVPGQSVAALQSAQVLSALQPNVQSASTRHILPGPALAAVAATVDAGLVAVLDAVGAGRGAAAVAAIRAPVVLADVGAHVDGGVAAGVRANVRAVRAAEVRAIGQRDSVARSVCLRVTRVPSRIVVFATRGCEQSNDQRTGEIRAHRTLPEKTAVARN
jgi:hypothetical protein